MRFFISDPKRGERIEIDFSVFVDLLKGTTITSAANSDDFLELGVTDAFNVRLEVGDDGLSCSLFSTSNEGDIPSLRFRLINEGDEPTAEMVEQQIHALRQTYAISYLLQVGRVEELEEAILANPNVDLESTLVPDEDRIFVVAAAPGSFWLTIATKTKKAYGVAKWALALPYQEGRDALLRRLHAGTRLQELAVEDKTLDVELKRTNGLIDTLNRIDDIKDEQSRSAVRDRLLGGLSQLESGEILTLPPPKGRQNGE